MEDILWMIIGIVLAILILGAIILAFQNLDLSAVVK
jgi:hypothetical protein